MRRFIAVLKKRFGNQNVDEITTYPTPMFTEDGYQLDDEFIEWMDK